MFSTTTTKFQSFWSIFSRFTPLLITSSLIAWVDAFEWICLFFVCMLSYYSVGTQSDDKRTLSMHWARLGLLVGFLAFVDFAADVLRVLDRHTFHKFALVIGIANTILLLPIWITYLSFNVHRVIPTYNPANDSFDAAITTTI